MKFNVVCLYSSPKISNKSSKFASNVKQSGKAIKLLGISILFFTVSSPIISPVLYLIFIVFESTKFPSIIKITLFK